MAFHTPTAVLRPARFERWHTSTHHPFIDADSGVVHDPADLSALTRAHIYSGISMGTLWIISREWVREFVDWGWSGRISIASATTAIATTSGCAGRT